MDAEQILNAFGWVKTPSLTDEQKRDVAKMLESFLKSPAFAAFVKSLANR